MALFAAPWRITNMPTEPEKKPLEPAPTQPEPEGGGHNEPPKQVITRASGL
jgi:hypothetical protein